MPITGTAAGESCYKGTMENNAWHAGCAAGLIRACQFIFHLQEIRLFLSAPPASPHSARRASTAPRPDKIEHRFFPPVMVSPRRGRIALRFLPRGIRDLEQPGKALTPHQEGLCLAGGGRARCPGAARSVPALGRSEQLTEAPCYSHPLTAPRSLFKRRICCSFALGVKTGRVTFSASAFHFLIVSVCADNPACSQSASFPCMTEALSSSENRGRKNSLCFPSMAGICSWELCWPLNMTKSSSVQCPNPSEAMLRGQRL